jgi:hypothetical protein
MINMIFGSHPTTGELWCFHTCDGQVTPFTDDEMADRRRQDRDAREIVIANIFNRDFVSGVTGERMESVPVPEGWYVSKGE